MPRFDPPHYLMEHDATRLREAQYARAGLRGHYLGASAAPQRNTRDTIKANRAKVQAEANKIVPGLISVNADGTLRLNDPISAIDRTISSVFPAAIKAAIDGLPFAGPNAQALKTKLKTRPLTFFLDVFDPALDALQGALEAVMVRGIDNTSAGFKNKTTRDTGRLGIGGFVYDLSTVPLPGLLNNPKVRNINIWLVQPGDELFDDNSRKLILRMRMVMAYIVLFFKKPVELQAEIVRASLDFLFGKPDDTLVSTVGEQENTPSTPQVVDRLPATAEIGRRQNERLYEGTVNGKVVYRVSSAGADRRTRTVYYTLSDKGLRDRKDALRGDYDTKYAAYVQDFKFWHPDFATRVAWVKNTEGKTEQQAVDKVAGEYELPRRFAEDQQLAKFRVVAPDRLGGPLLTIKNGQRRDLKGLGAFGAAGGGVAEGAVAKGTTDAAAPVVGPTVLDQILAFLASLVPVISAITTLVVALNKPAVEQEKTKQAEAAAREAEAGASIERERLESQSAASSNKTMLIAGAAVLAGIFILNKKRTAT